MTQRRIGLGGRSSISAVAAMAMLASQGAVHESTPSIEQRKRRELHDYDDTPCQAPASDFNHDEANKRHELKIQRQDQKRFQQRQQAKFNTKGRR